jgi:hypothetical protein
LFISIIGFPISFMHFGEKAACDIFFSNQDITHASGTLKF